MRVGCSRRRPLRRRLRHRQSYRTLRQRALEVISEFMFSINLGGDPSLVWDKKIEVVFLDRYLADRMEEALKQKSPRLAHSGVKVVVTPFFNPSINRLTFKMTIYVENKNDIDKQMIIHSVVDSLNYVQRTRRLQGYFYPARKDDEDYRFKEEDLDVGPPKSIDRMPENRIKGAVPVEYYLDDFRGLEMIRITQGTLLYRRPQGGDAVEDGVFMTGTPEVPNDGGRMDTLEVNRDIHLLVFSEDNMRRLYNNNPYSEIAKVISKVLNIGSTTVSCARELSKPDESMIYCPDPSSTMLLGRSLRNLGFSGWYVPPKVVTRLHASETILYVEEEVLVFDIDKFAFLKETRIVS
jgi:hypothetical protein